MLVSITGRLVKVKGVGKTLDKISVFIVLSVASFKGFNIQVGEGDFGALLFDREANVARGEGCTALAVGDGFANGYVIDPEMEGVATGLNRDGIRFALRLQGYRSLPK